MSPSQLTCETHRLDNDNQETLIVLALAVIDTVSGESEFSAARSEATLLLRPNGVVEQVEIIGCPLGIQPNSTYSKSTQFLEIGATTVIATDGITEVRRGSDFLGPEGMTAVIAEAGPVKSPAELGQAIYAAARDVAGRALHDDACVLVARRVSGD